MQRVFRAKCVAASSLRAKVCRHLGAFWHSQGPFQATALIFRLIIRVQSVRGTASERRLGTRRARAQVLGVFSFFSPSYSALHGETPSSPIGGLRQAGLSSGDAWFFARWRGLWALHSCFVDAQQIHTPENDGDVLVARIRTDQQAAFNLLRIGERVV